MRTSRLCLLALSIPLSPLHAAEPTWHPLQWVEAEVVPGEGKVKAALLLPIKVNGIDCTAQLDTGAPGKVI